LDIGLPLDCDFTDEPEDYLPQPLFDKIKYREKRFDAVILSHAHLDHCGLSGMLPKGIPVYCVKASAELIKVSCQLNPVQQSFFKPQTYQSCKTFEIGPFSISPYLMDHSAFDAHGFILKAGGKSVFYTGDFCRYGRKVNSLSV
jgi:ribonuclease J